MMFYGRCAKEAFDIVVAFSVPIGNLLRQSTTQGLLSVVVFASHPFLFYLVALQESEAEKTTLCNFPLSMQDEECQQVAFWKNSVRGTIPNME